MKKITFILLLLSLCAVCSFAQNDVDAINLLKSNDLETRHRAIDVLNNKRDEIINNLISILNTSMLPDVKDSAVTLLGDYRASKSVNELIQNIGLDIRPRIIKGFLSEEESHPVSTALEKIGNPSIPVVIEFLEEKGSVMEKGKTLEDRNNIEITVLLLRDLCRIDGNKDIVGLRLQKALKAEMDPQKQARLQAALKKLDKISF